MNMGELMRGRIVAVVVIALPMCTAVACSSTESQPVPDIDFSFDERAAAVDGCVGVVTTAISADRNGASGDRTDGMLRGEVQAYYEAKLEVPPGTADSVFDHEAIIRGICERHM